MPLWLEKRYANMVSPRLEQFKWKKANLANFRCPVCGDSQRNKRKARGYLYTKNGTMFYKCHNCPASMNFSNFLKFLDPELHIEFIRETFAERSSPVTITTTPVPEKPVWVSLSNREDYGDSISNLPEEHFAVQYIKNRRIPKEFWKDLVYTQNTKSYIENVIDKDTNAPAVPSVLILIKDENGNLIGVNGRSLKPENNYSKYIKAKVNDDVHLIFGLDRLDKTKKVYVFEGEFDSMFLPNAVAVGGVGMMDGVENLLGVNKEQVVQVVDNDPRKPEVVKVLNQLIEDGYNVVILPGNIEGKDVNDLVMQDKLTTEQIKELIDNNTVSGLIAKMKLAEWRKCNYYGSVSSWR